MEAAAAAQPAGQQPNRLLLKTYEEENKRLKMDVAQKEVEMREKELELSKLKQKLMEMESKKFAAEKIALENSSFRDGVLRMHKIATELLSVD